MKAHYFTTAVRTGGGGMGGVSLLLIPAKLEGVRTTRMKTQGWWISNTALLTFDNVRVPCSYLIGKENEGFKHIMSNFNHGPPTAAARPLPAAASFPHRSLSRAVRAGRVVEPVR